MRNFNVSNTDPICQKLKQTSSLQLTTLPKQKPISAVQINGRQKPFLQRPICLNINIPMHVLYCRISLRTGVTPNGTKYALVAKYEDNFDPATKNNSESVFAVQCSVHDGSGGDNGNTKTGSGYTGPDGGPIVDYGWLQPSQSMANSYKTDSSTGLPYIYTYNDYDIKSDLNVASSDPYTPIQEPWIPALTGLWAEGNSIS